MEAMATAIRKPIMLGAQKIRFEIRARGDASCCFVLASCTVT